MTATVLEIPTHPSTNQKFTVTLSDQTFLISLHWCPPAGCWVMDMGDIDGTPIANGLALVTGSDILEQLAYLGFQGAIIVQSDNDADLVPTFDTLGDTGHLYYVIPDAPVVPPKRPPSIVSADVGLVAPTLTNPSAAPFTVNDCQLGAITDQSDGTFYVVVTPNNVPPSAEQIEAGLDATGTAGVAIGSTPVTATGQQSITVTTLPANSVFHAFFVHKNGEGVPSNVVGTNAFTTPVS